VCLYQGEELGLTEAELAFEDLRDPYGIRFWPQFKGRDGCRTPFAWEAAAPAGGFTTGRPWLPVPPEHLGMAVDAQEGDPESVLEHYRRFLAFRRAHPALARGEIAFLATEADTLAFLRRLGNEDIICAFNLGAAPSDLDLGMRAGPPLAGHGFTGTAEGTRVSLPPYGAWFGHAA
jgi:alpha-glucosidase